MKIAFFCSSEAWGGLEMNLFRLAYRLKNRGHVIVLFAQPGTTIFKEAVKTGVETIALPVKRHYVDFMAARKLAIQLKKKKIYVLLFSIAKDNYVAGWAKTFFYSQLHIIYVQQMILGIPKKGIVQTFLYRKLSAWISPLQVLATQVTQQTHMPPDKIYVIPLGIETDIFSAHFLTKAEARRQLQLPEEIFLAGTIGRLDPSKGQDQLIEAVHLLREKNIELHALFVGKETFGDTRKYPQFLQDLTKKLNAEGFIHFREFTSKAELAFAALDVFVMSSHAEAYGMVTIEAMASGLPVIGTNIGGTPEILENGKLGLLIEPKQEKQLAEALEKLYVDGKLRADLGIKAKQAALNKYSYQKQCELVEQLLEKLIGETHDES